MAFEDLLACSEMCATGLYPESDASIPEFPTLFL